MKLPNLKVQGCTNSWRPEGMHSGFCELCSEILRYQMLRVTKAKHSGHAVLILPNLNPGGPNVMGAGFSELC